MLDVYFERVTRRRGIHFSDNALTAASSALLSKTLGSIEVFGSPEAHVFVLRMGGIADGIEVFGIAWRTAHVFRRTTAGCQSACKIGSDANLVQRRLFGTD